MIIDKHFNMIGATPCVICMPNTEIMKRQWPQWSKCKSVKTENGGWFISPIDVIVCWFLKLYATF